MTNFDALILGALQGLTEFLPISSSGHLILAENWLGLDVEALKGFDVFVHFGTLFAILIYFWRDIFKILKSAKFIAFIILGTIPAVLLGFFGGDKIDYVFRNPHSVAINLMIVALIFLLAEFIYKKFFRTKIEMEGMKWWQVLIIGMAQAVALIPGVSRSGATITAGIFQGVKREEAARFSFLLGAPAIFGAAALTMVKPGFASDLAANFAPPLIGFFASFAVGLLCIFFLLKFLKNHTLTIFAVYRILLALILLFW